MSRIKVIAITGASGFIGSYLVDRLAFPQKRLTRKIRTNNSSHTNFEWVVGDYRHVDEILGFVENAPVLIHLAAKSNPRSSNLNIAQDITDHLISSVNLFEAYSKANPKGHIIFCSSGGNMYLANSHEGFASEADPPMPRSSYGIHKLAIEHYLRLFCEMYGISGSILRLSNPYGVLLPKERTQGVIGVTLAKVLAKEAVPVFDSLKSLRDYVHLEDVASAFNLMIEHPPAPYECREFNVCAGVSYSLDEVFELIESVTKLPVLKDFAKTDLPPPTLSLLSHEKIKKAFGWSPKINLRDGISKMYTERD